MFELKPLPNNLKYVNPDEKKIYPVIISANLSKHEEERLLKTLKKHRAAIGYTLDDLKGISPTLCHNKIKTDLDSKPVADNQRRLNPKMKEVVRKEILNGLQKSRNKFSPASKIKPHRMNIYLGPKCNFEKCAFFLNSNKIANKTK